MKQTKIIICPACKLVQDEDVLNLASDSGDMSGSIEHSCQKCNTGFTIKYEIKAFLEIKSKRR